MNWMFQNCSKRINTSEILCLKRISLFKLLLMYSSLLCLCFSRSTLQKYLYIEIKTILLYTFGQNKSFSFDSVTSFWRFTDSCEQSQMIDEVSNILVYYELVRILKWGPTPCSFRCLHVYICSLQSVEIKDRIQLHWYSCLVPFYWLKVSGISAAGYF